MTPPEPPFRCSYWLPDRRLIAGQYPGSADPDAARKRIGALLDAGVRTFINLTEEHEPLEPYEDLLYEEARTRDIEVIHVRVPIRDANVPDSGVMEQVLDLIREAQDADRIPYVHCWGGIGRTGTVVGCHLVEQGHSAEEALYMVQSFFETYERGYSPYRSPETSAQRDFVRNWKRRPLPIERLTFDTQRMMEQHPPVLRDRNKISVFGICCPAGSKYHGELAYSRWAAMQLPAEVDPNQAIGLLQQKEDVFDYAPVLDGAIEWHVNFADPHLFVAYGSGLFAQDEMQVAEHPALGALAEALRATGSPALTVENGAPTPILIKGVERRCRIATDADTAAGRPKGLYGNAFRTATEVAIRNAVSRMDPPTITNLIAIAAPSGGHGRYSVHEIEHILTTAYTGFRAAVLESSPEPTVIHTGFWGCGAFGGNRILMAMLQILAASMAQADQLVFHTFNPAGSAALRSARDQLERSRSGETHTLLSEIESLGLQWGESDGN